MQQPAYSHWLPQCLSLPMLPFSFCFHRCIKTLLSCHFFFLWLHSSYRNIGLGAFLAWLQLCEITTNYSLWWYQETSSSFFDNINQFCNIPVHGISITSIHININNDKVFCFKWRSVKVVMLLYLFMMHSEYSDGAHTFLLNLTFDSSQKKKKLKVKVCICFCS